MKFKYQLLGLAVIYSFNVANAHEKSITLIDVAGQTSYLAINDADKFLDVVENLQNYYAATLVKSNPNVELNMSIDNKNVVIRAMKVGRDYSQKVSKDQKADIEDVISQMAYSDLSKLWKNRAKLKKTGVTFESIHPLRFLETICTNDVTIAGVKGIYDRIFLGAWVWKEFAEGCVRTLKEEDARGNVLPHVAEFAKNIKVDPNILLPLAEKGKWDDFVEKVVELVPRKIDADLLKDM